MPETPQIGFVGIGAMGSRMAARLTAAGHPVTIFDIDRDRQQRFADSHQCRSAKSLAEVGEGADIVITMLPDGTVVRHALLEAEDGALAKALKAGSVVLDTSSSDPVGTRAVASRLAERGIGMVDAPVSGGITGAENGRLVFMVGGDDPAAVERVRPVLERLGHKMFVVGGVGCGHAMKCLNNFVSGTGFLAALEALLIGARFGLDPSGMVDVLNESTGQNFSTRNVLKQEVISRAFGTEFQLGLLAKDVRIAADLAEDVHISAPVSRLTCDLLAHARDRLGYAADHSEAVKYWEYLNATRLDAEPKEAG